MQNAGVASGGGGSTSVQQVVVVANDPVVAMDCCWPRAAEGRVVSLVNTVIVMVSRIAIAWRHSRSCRCRRQRILPSCVQWPIFEISSPAFFALCFDNLTRAVLIPGF